MERAKYPRNFSALLFLKTTHNTPLPATLRAVPGSVMFTGQKYVTLENGGEGQPLSVVGGESVSTLTEHISTCSLSVGFVFLKPQNRIQPATFSPSRKSSKETGEGPKQNFEEYGNSSEGK